MLKWFDAREAKAFALQLVKVVEVRTPDEVKKLTEKKLGKKHETILFQLEKQINAFRKTHVLNIYTKAQLGNVFRWALIDKQYDKEYVEQLTAWVLRKF